MAVTVIVDHGGHAHSYQTRFVEHAHADNEHGHHGHHGHAHDDPDVSNDPLYAPLRSGAAVLMRHRHAHRHGNGPAHVHLHDHDAATVHEIAPWTHTETR